MARNPKYTVASFSDAARPLAEQLNASFVRLRMSTYAAGERVAHVGARVRGSCFLVEDVGADAESLLRVLLAANALMHSGASSVSLVAPWMAYGRQDRPTHPQESVGGEVIGVLFRSIFRRIFTLDAHSPAFVSLFGGRLVSCFPAGIAADIASKHRATAIAAPDGGARDRARAVSTILGLPLLVCQKSRSKPGRRGVSVRAVSGEPRGHRVLLIDDMVDSGGTLAEAAQMLKKYGAVSVGAVVTHAANPKRVPSAATLGLSLLTVLHPRIRARIPPQITDLLSVAVRQAR